MAILLCGLAELLGQQVRYQIQAIGIATEDQFLHPATCQRGDQLVAWGNGQVWQTSDLEAVRVGGSDPAGFVWPGNIGGAGEQLD